MTRIACIALLLACGRASAAGDVRFGLHLAGHLLFTDMIEATGSSPR